MKDNNWARLLAYVSGLVNQQLLLQNEYLIAENRILRSHLPKRLRLSDPQRVTLAEIGKRLGRKALREVACVANRTPFWLGIAGSSPRSSMVQSADAHPDARKSTLQLKIWRSAWRARIPAGDTTESSELSPTSDTKFRIRPLATF